MRFRGAAAAVGALILLSTTAAKCNPTTATDTTLLVDGLTVTVHDTPRSAPQPLVLALHGIGSTGADFAKTTGLNAFADAHGFAVAYPDAHVAPHMPTPTPSPTPAPSPTPSPTPKPTPTATPSPTPTPSPMGINAQRAQLARGVVEDLRSLGKASSNRAWNAGDCCGGSTTNDVRYLQDVVATMAFHTRIDLRRVYVVGLSNGGMMALRAVCEAPTVFAAAGSVAGPYLGTSCARPIWRHLHGADDPVVPYLGGVSPGSAWLHVAQNWCLCSFPDSATESARFSPRTVSVQLVKTGVHSWPRRGDGAWNLDGNGDLWSFLSRYHL